MPTLEEIMKANTDAEELQLARGTITQLRQCIEAALCAVCGEMIGERDFCIGGADDNLRHEGCDDS